MAVNLAIPSLGSKFQDYRDGIPGDSYAWGPAIAAGNIRYFTFHHSVTNAIGDWKKECDQLANIHINQGWNGIGYRFVICSDGTVAYVGDLGRGGSAVANHNHEMFSACFIGDFTKLPSPNQAQIRGAHLLAKHFLTAMPQYPNLTSWDQIKGHRDFNQTACPGNNWRDGTNLRNKIITYKDTTPAPPPTTDVAKLMELIHYKNPWWDSLYRVKEMRKALPTWGPYNLPRFKELLWFDNAWWGSLYRVKEMRKILPK